MAEKKLTQSFSLFKTDLNNVTKKQFSLRNADCYLSSSGILAFMEHSAKKASQIAAEIKRIPVWPVKDLREAVILSKNKHIHYVGTVSVVW